MNVDGQTDTQSKCRQMTELLPWSINGTLSDEEEAALSAHLEACPACQSELAAMSKISATLQQADDLLLVEHEHWRRMQDRLKHDSPVQAEPSYQHSSSSASMTIWRLFLDRLRALTQTWNVAPIAVAVSVLVVVVVIAGRGPMDSADYRTLTNTPATDEAIRVLIEQDVREDQLRALLLREGLEIVAGPSTAGVYTLAPSDLEDATDLDEHAASLAEAPEIAFVSVGTEP